MELWLFRTDDLTKTQLLTYILLTIISTLYFLNWLIYSAKEKRKFHLPPGPWLKVPYLGHLPFLDPDFLKTFSKLKLKYGPIFHLKLGERRVIVLNNFSAIKEALNKDAFLRRPPNPPNHLLKTSQSLSVNNGIVWKEQNQFTLQSMKYFGSEMTKMEVHIKEEINHLINEIQIFNGQEMNVRQYLGSSISNTISAFLFGHRIDYHDSTRKHLDQILVDLDNFFRPTSAHAFFPWLKKFLVFFKIWGYEKLEYATAKLVDYINEEIDDHKTTLDSNEIRDYVDKFLFQIEQSASKGPNTSFTRDMLKGNLFSLYAAGSLTILSALEWTLLILAKYQDIQAKMLEEIYEVLGKERPPNWIDHGEMPFVEAVLMEVQRWKTIVPINLLRYTDEDNNIAGYDIPRGTTVIVNIHAAHNDTSCWDQPEKFNPERFLSADGKTIINHESWIPRSAGKRACPAGNLANVAIFLHAASLLQKFHIKFPPGKEHSLEGNLAAVFSPKPYELCLIPRN